MDGRADRACVGPGARKAKATNMFRGEVGDRVVLVPKLVTRLWARISRRQRAGRRGAALGLPGRSATSQPTVGPGPDACGSPFVRAVDGYWPGNDGENGFSSAVGTSMEHEFAMTRRDSSRGDAVRPGRLGPSPASP